MKKITSSTRSQQLMEKSIQSIVAAIEIFNKPVFLYRYDSFSILIINAWEALLKSKIVKDNGENLDSIYVKDKNGEYKTSRSGKNQTIGIFECLAKISNNSKEKISEIKTNLDLIVEYRDCAIHYMNDENEIEKELYNISVPCVRNFVEMIDQWFPGEIEKQRFSVLPISFNNHNSLLEIHANKHEFSRWVYLYAEQKEKEAQENGLPYDIKNTIIEIQINPTKNKSNGVDINSDTRSESSLDIGVCLKDMKLRYPHTYNEVATKCKNRYSDFKQDAKFKNIMKKIKENSSKSYKHPHKINSPEGNGTYYYSGQVFEDLDQQYSRKK